MPKCTFASVKAGMEPHVFCGFAPKGCMVRGVKYALKNLSTTYVQAAHSSESFFNAPPVGAAENQTFKAKERVENELKILKKPGP